ncbi:hypothetical protein VNO78_22319 [Psophocarpus tetragonolobus]|uniref:BHLH domain-containing protein n=1 Tax=Psophocarpus tetragonolobus TaxID=3891 RepID=A0AAN9SEQ8_PSOTE
MDRFFPEKLLGEIFWDDQAFPPATQSAFVQYRDLPRTSNSQNFNMSKRMLEFLRKSWPVERTNNERDRGFRHMINERMRRQRQRHCCLALHSILPHGTKTDNNSVIQMAAKEIVRLQGRREELQSKADLESGRTNVQYLRVSHPNSGIDSMVDILKCLKNKGVDTTRIRSTFSPHDLFAVFDMQTHNL